MPNLERRVHSCVQAALGRLQTAAGSAHQHRIRAQGKVCLDEAQVALEQLQRDTRTIIDAVRKQASGRLAPHIQDRLEDGYARASGISGTGRWANQKVGASIISHTVD
jgi:hypothetical protein